MVMIMSPKHIFLKSVSWKDLKKKQSNAVSAKEDDAKIAEARAPDDTKVPDDTEARIDPDFMVLAVVQVDSEGTNDLINQADDLIENQAESLPSVEGQKSPRSASLKSLGRKLKVALSPRSKSKKMFDEEPASTPDQAAEPEKEEDADNLVVEDEAVSIYII